MRLLLISPNAAISIAIVANRFFAIIIVCCYLYFRVSEYGLCLHLVDIHFRLYIFFLFHSSQFFLFDDNFHSLVATLYDVDALLRLVKAFALQVVVFSLVVGNGVEGVDGCSAVVVEADTKHLGTS